MKRPRLANDASCGTCGQAFAGERTFVAHRTKAGECLEPTAVGMAELLSRRPAQVWGFTLYAGAEWFGPLVQPSLVDVR